MQGYQSFPEYQEEFKREKLYCHLLYLAAEFKALVQPKTKQTPHTISNPRSYPIVYAEIVECYRQCYGGQYEILKDSGMGIIKETDRLSVLREKVLSGPKNKVVG